MKISDLPKQLKKDIQQTLKQYHMVTEPQSTELSNLVLVQMREQNQTTLPKRQAINAVLDEGLSQMMLRQPESGQILSRRFRDKISIAQVSQELSLTIDQVKHKQKDGFEELAKIIWTMDYEARLARVAEQKAS